MAGLLDNFFKRPGAGEGLGLLGAYLMAAGGPSTDPGAAQRLMAQGLQAYAGQLKEAREAEEMKKFRAAQTADLEARTKERQATTAGRERALGLLNDPWINPDTGQPAPVPGQGPKGLLSQLPETSRPFIQGMAAMDPVAAYKAGLEQVTPQKPVSIPAGGALVDPRTGQTVAERPDKPMSSVGKLQADLAAGRITKAQYDEGLALMNRGFAFDFDPQGRITSVRQGPGAAGGAMQKKTIGDIEEKLLASKEQLARLTTIASQFKPEYQEIPTRFGAAWTGLKARFGDKDVPPQERQLLTQFAAYRRDAIDNINLYIKEITGAQMSEAEAGRLRQGVPDPGEGIFGGDDPITFKSKMDSTMKAAMKARARYNYYLQNGVADVETMAKQTPLDSIETAINPETGERAYKINGQWIRG